MSTTTHELVACACDPCDRETVERGYCLPCMDAGCDRGEPQCGYAEEN